MASGVSGASGSAHLNPKPPARRSFESAQREIVESHICMIKLVFF